MAALVPPDPETRMPVWLDFDDRLAVWLLGTSLFVFVAGLLLGPMVLVKMPADYFVRSSSPWARHPVLRALFAGARNTLSAILIAAGILMLVMPGQGLLTILAGVAVASFPGKKRLLLLVVRRRPVLRSINWIRQKADAPPLQLPPKED